MSLARSMFNGSMPRLISVNVGTPRSFVLKGKTHTSSIWKFPVEGRVRVEGVNVQGDEQADHKVHGGADKAIYAYASEDYAWWSEELGTNVEAGTFGENLTTAGIDVNRSVIGERWRVGSAMLEVSQPRLPCFKLGFRMGDARFPRRFSDAGRWGTYLRIIQEGDVAAGDPIEVLERPDHDVTIDRVAQAYFRNKADASALLAAPQLPRGWKDWALKETGSG